MYAPAGERQFDRIVVHPPYVPVLRPKYIYHDGGDDGEQIVRRAVTEMFPYLAPGGLTQLNVAIRSPIIMRDGRGEMGIGSGVVYDSQGGREYDECLLKMKFLTDGPRCTVAQIWSKAIAQGAPENAVAIVQFDARGGYWTFKITDKIRRVNFDRTFPDNCAPAAPPKKTTPS